MTEELAPDVAPDVEPEIQEDETPDVEPEEVEEEMDPEEAEYQAKMAELREEREDEEDDDEDEEDDQEEKPKEDEKSKDEKKDDPDKKTWKLKVGDKEEEVDESELVRRAQKATGADVKFQEAAKIRQSTERFLTALRSNPAAVLSNPQLGINFREVAEEFLFNQIQEDRLSPEEKAQRQRDRELEQYREQERNRKLEEKQRADEELREKYRQDWSEKFKEAITEAGLPGSPWVVQQMAAYMRAARQRNLQLGPKDVTEYVRKDLLQAQRELLQSQDGDKLLETLGDDAADKLRKADLARYQKKPKAPPQSAGAAPRRQKNEPVFTSMEDFRDSFASRRRRR